MGVNVLTLNKYMIKKVMSCGIIKDIHFVVDEWLLRLHCFGRHTPCKDIVYKMLLATQTQRVG